ncbi:glycosyltransferase family 2 protein [Desulfoprunum benzoelyticum]|uniref:Rhamnosyltransferase n=1 Tax=Desulfoprunum benzoelyticum TaxID=1506996 RepID=A0A840UT82_9BACT|nr:glycosyltransferase family 2 protein [Desulfoprunum benzoelyticum]MBB5346574.1 rhamnosyltransferase [Desulfoprunum benzoelyticum]MBM9528897.1 glycosyltransferase family 2 protein [Desulfoprunum benzoelyticum]
MQDGQRQTPTLSVIIPTCNGAATLGELLAVLARQTIQPDEILVVDSSSEDETVAIARHYGAKVTIIARESFDHGGTRTQLAGTARGELLLFLTQDAIPATREALAQLIRPFAAHPEVAVSYGRQLPHRDATWSAASLRAFNYPPQSCLRDFNDRKRYGLRTIFVSNSFAAYRRQALAEVGYFKNGLIFGEDTCTVGRLLQRGYRIAYVGEARVYHSHNYSLAEEFRRSFDIGVLHATEHWLLETYGHAEGIGLTMVRRQLTELGRRRRVALMADVVVRSVLKYCGYRLGRSFRKIPAQYVPSLSMHRTWWQGRSATDPSSPAGT